MPYVPTQDRPSLDRIAESLASEIAAVSKKYEYDGAFLGELNYALTRLIQHLPRKLGLVGEIRYWLYAGIVGVLVDVKDEYKRRVNTAYEAAQIEKSGDCYDTPYYTRLIDVVREDGSKIGTMEVQMKRDDFTLSISKLPLKLVAR